MDEFMYSMAGGDATRFPVVREDQAEEGPIEVNLTTAPAIVHRVPRDESFVTSLKRKFSVRRYVLWTPRRSSLFPRCQRFTGPLCLLAGREHLVYIQW